MGQHEVNNHGDARKAGQSFSNSTATNWSHGAKELWKNPRVTMIRIEVLVSLVAGVLLLLAISGSRRRRSRHWFVQNGVLAAYTLCFSLTTYLLGSMQSSELKSSMYPIWAISLFMLHACTDTITAYSLDDNTQEIRLLYQGNMYALYTMLLVITVQATDSYGGAIIYLAVLTYFRYTQRFAACMLASSSWNLNKIVADYMYEVQDKDVLSAREDTVPAVTGQDFMKDCSYLVDWPISKSKFDAPTYATQLTADTEKAQVIDIAKIWRCEDESLGPELKDACVSFSLFHLLRRRYFEFACDESKDRAHDFVFIGLLSDGSTETEYNRVFKVIEVELAFMYDFFFTKYAVIYYASVPATIWSLVSVISISIVAYITARVPLKISEGGSAVPSTATDDIVITLVILTSTALLELSQLLFYWMGIWGRVSFVCQFIREQARLNRDKASAGGSSHKLDVCLASRIMALKGFLANIGVRFPPNKHYWRHKLGQYSLLDPVNFNPSRSFVSCILSNRLIDKLFRALALADYTFRHPRNDQEIALKSVELTDEVKKAIICSLKHSNGTLRNGKSSLRKAQAHHLLWACELRIHPVPSWSQRNQNQTHIILIWHIATCYCEMVKISPDRAQDLKVPFSVATTLSKYCAYLVISAPSLLPGHHYDTDQKFDAAAVEAVTLLQLQRGITMYEAMKSLIVAEDSKTIFESGVKLGKQLEEMEECVRWKVMADFWAEMMLYLAPSDNVKGHIGRLAQGGEFITHLWALLSHAGILKREQEYVV